MDKEQIRQKAAERVNAIYGLKDPSPEDVKKMIDTHFGPSPVVMFPGMPQQHLLFGCHQGHGNLNAHYNSFYETIEVQRLKEQFTMVDGSCADIHYEAEFKIKESGSVFELEFVALADMDTDGKFRTLKLFFDTATFLKAVNNKNQTFTDVREKDPHPAFDPNGKPYAGKLMSEFYDLFGQCYMGLESYDKLYDHMNEDVEVCFKSDVDVIPYAGQYSGKEGFKQWFANLFSLWRLCAFNFTRIVAEGNMADFEIHELHYYDNPDGTQRYLDCYIVQSWLMDENGKMHRFKSYHDSNWLVETFYATEAYKAHYGYPKDYPPGK